VTELVYVSVGSNIDRSANIRAAITALRHRYGELSLSPVYESASEGFDGADFYNLVLTFYANNAQETRASLKAIELAQKRDPDCAKFSDRSLDLDILLFGEQVLYEQGLDIPRREILEYAFVLCPLADLAPDLCHPIVAKTYEKLWREFTHTKSVVASSVQSTQLQQIVKKVSFDWDI